MPNDSHHSHADDQASFVHRGRYGIIPATISAAALTALHQYSLAFTVGAVVGWLLTALFIALQTMHRWDVCTLCDYPPKHLATPTARAREARRVHSRTGRFLGQMLIAGTLSSALFPKPYLHFWWGQLAVAVLYAATALTMARAGSRGVQHQEYRDECHLEWCRANRKKPHPIRAWIGHYGPWLLAILVPDTFLLGMIALHGGLLDQLAYAEASLALTFVVLSMLLDHTDMPCVRCAKNPPSNGGEQAERRMTWLRSYHYLRYRLLGASFFLWGASWLVPGTVPGRALMAVAALLLVPWAVLSRVHGKVQPWCPWCRDDGGESEEAEVPDPSWNQPVPV